MNKEFFEKVLKGRQSVLIRNLDKPYLKSKIGYVKEKNENQLILEYAEGDLPLIYDLKLSYVSETWGSGNVKVEHFKNGNLEVVLVS